MRLIKRIPVAAGLAGGSSDAAAVLRALNRAFRRPLTEKRLLELAAELGKATAVMSTEKSTGATPASFSAHEPDRDNSSEILDDQTALTEKYGTIIECNFDYYTDRYMKNSIEKRITDTLTKLSADSDGFFLMYEEAHIDKHSHDNDMEDTFKALIRFNQAIARFMEYAFYHPDTMVIITADHETGGLSDMGGILKYSHGDHTGKAVPVFAYGIGTEVFHEQEIENVQIPKTIAKMWGQSLATDTDSQWPPLN
jgi:alkaline phosphatase